MKHLPAISAFVAVFSLGFTAGTIRNQNEPASSDNVELAKMYQEDQAVRSVPFESIDWEKVSKQDLQHRVRVAELLKEDKVQTANDYFHAAMIYQHASDKDGYKLAHELSVIGAIKGNKTSIWLSAASWDRFLNSMKENQRFGTQYSSKDGKTFELNTTDEMVSDSMRKAMSCPTLQQAKDRAKDFQPSP